MNYNYKIIVYNKFGDKFRQEGELFNVFDINTKETLDKTGYLSISLDITNPMLERITDGTEIELYTKNEGFVNRYIYNSSRTDISKNQIPRISLTFLDLSSVFAYIPIDNRTKVSGTITDIFTSCLSQYLPDWNVSVLSETGQTYTFDFVYTNFQLILNEITKQTNFHWRVLGRTLEIGNFGENSGLTATTANYAVNPLNIPPNTIAINSIRKIDEIGGIYNCIIPYSSNGSNDVLTLENAIGGNYTIKSKSVVMSCGVSDPNISGPFYYIEDGASVVKYGKRFMFLSLDEIKSDSNSASDIAKAKTQLKLAAEAELIFRKSPQAIYEFDFMPLSEFSLKVGQSIYIDYQLVINNKSYLNLTGNYYVINKSINRSASQISYSFDVSNIARSPENDFDYLFGVNAQIKQIKDNEIL